MSNTEENKTKTIWHSVDRFTEVMNTATGSAMRICDEEAETGVSVTFIPGEHWDPETKAFLPVGEVVNNSNLDLLLAGLAAIMEDAR